MNDRELLLKQWAEEHYKVEAEKIYKLPQSGSNRLYYRITFANFPSIIGVFNEDIKENEAFFSFTQTFLQHEIPVPQLLHIHDSRQYYWLSDLGDATLYSLLEEGRVGQTLGMETKALYRQAVAFLPKLQLLGRDTIDFSVCYPRAAFDEQSMQWDLNYFKYYFLKLANIPFDEQALENDFSTLITHLAAVDRNFFLFRDFQSRNIMVKEGNVYFIDYQGGRKGALAYDLASLLYDGKANLSHEYRAELLQYYIECASQYLPIEKVQFEKDYYSFVLIRILQALGAYGYRGYYEKKSHFLLSIPFAIENLKYLLAHQLIQVELPTLFAVLEQMFQSDFIAQCVMPTSEGLTVSVNSFSFKKEFPNDMSGNGGGFVFDCRFLPNPGREVQYKKLTGKDQGVIDYLEQYEEVADFKSQTLNMIRPAINNYLHRNFQHLMINFGCTGGQHRSVYFAEQITKQLQQEYPNIRVVLKHWMAPWGK